MAVSSSQRVSRQESDCEQVQTGYPDCVFSIVSFLPSQGDSCVDATSTQIAALLSSQKSLGCLCQSPTKPSQRHIVFFDQVQRR